MELRHLVTFRVVAQTLSFTQAAQRLGYVQSAVSQHIKALEQQLGVALFDRMGRRVALTEAGTQLFEYAVRIDQLTQDALAAVRGGGESVGPVRVSAPETLCAHRLPRMLQQFYHDHPQVRVLFEANPTGALSDELARALGLGEVDLAFVLEGRLEPAVPLFAEPLTEEPLVVIAAPHHPLANADAVTPSDLHRAAFLMTEKGCCYRSTLERVLADGQVRPEIIGEFTSSETIKRCVQAGGALGMVAAVSVADELTSGELIALSWRGPQLRVRSYLVWNTRRWITPAMQALIETARNTVGQARQGIPAAAVAQ